MEIHDLGPGLHHVIHEVHTNRPCRMDVYMLGTKWAVLPCVHLMDNIPRRAPEHGPIARMRVHARGKLRLQTASNCMLHTLRALQMYTRAHHDVRWKQGGTATRLHTYRCARMPCCMQKASAPHFQAPGVVGVLLLLNCRGACSCPPDGSSCLALWAWPLAWRGQSHMTIVSGACAPPLRWQYARCGPRLDVAGGSCRPHGWRVGAATPNGGWVGCWQPRTCV